MDFPDLTKVLEFLARELSTIVGYQRVWDAKPGDYVLPYKLFYGFRGDGRHGFYFYPFRKGVHGDNEEFPLVSGHWERPYNVDLPKIKRPWRSDGVQGSCV